MTSPKHESASLLERFARALTQWTGSTSAFTMAFGITEADAGSNSHQITTTARRDGDEWVLSGQKTFISGVDEAQAVLIVSRTEDRRTGKLLADNLRTVG